MGIFWSYIQDKLHWPLIFRPGPLSAVIEGLARVFDDVREDMVWLRNQFSPVTCEDEQLPAHAESRGILRHPLETQEQYRKRCLKAFAWNMLGGGSQGLPKILEHYGYPNTDIQNVRKEEEERWAEFKVNVGVPETGMKADEFILTGDVVNDQKPARSVLAGLNAKTNGASIVYVGTAPAQTAVKTSVWPFQPGDIEMGGITLFAATGLTAHVKTTVYPLEENDG